MPELRGMRAVVQFLRQSAEPCAAPPTSPFMTLLMDPLAVKAHSHAVRPSAPASSLLFCAAARSSADPGPGQSER